MNSPISSFKLIAINQAADNPYVEVVPDEYPDVIIRVSGKKQSRINSIGYNRSAFA